MKRLVLTGLFVLFAPIATSAQEPESARSYVEFSQLRSDLLELVEFRTQAIQDYENLRVKIENREAFSGRELNRLHEIVVTKRPLLERLLTASQKMDRVRRIHGPIQLENLAIQLTLADTYWSAIHFFHEDNRLRRIINEGKSVLKKDGNVMKRLLRKFLKKSNVKSIAFGIETYAQLDENVHARFSEHENTRFLATLVEKSALYADWKASGQNDLQKFLRERLEYRNKPQDLTHKLGTSMLYAVSQVFGNGIGLLHFRSGHLRDDPEAQAQIQSVLKPLDILMEKTPFRLTDTFIPGYWGHAAIWLGTESELRALDLWEHPAFIPLHEEIRSGRGIMQALRPGTSIDSVESFLNVDDLAVLRIREMSIEQKKEALVVAAAQYRKIYDFAFDVETQNVLVCSELIFMSFLDIDWRLEKTLGRWTINPDAVAERAVPGRELKVIELYTGGHRQVGDLNLKMKHILANPNRSDKKLLRDFANGGSSLKVLP